jgi:hypothetical protein
MCLLKNSAFLLAAALLSGCGGNMDRSGEPAAQKPVALKSFVLHDVQPRVGGYAVWARKDGPMVIQAVDFMSISEPDLLREKRYKLNSRPGVYSEVELIVASRNLMDLKLKKEADASSNLRTSIMLVPETGPTVKLVRWGNTSNSGFDQLLLYLRGRCDEIRVQEKPVYEGQYDKDWRPEGFERPW